MRRLISCSRKFGTSNNIWYRGKQSAYIVDVFNHFSYSNGNAYEGRGSCALWQSSSDLPLGWQCWTTAYSTEKLLLRTSDVDEDVYVDEETIKKSKF